VRGGAVGGNSVGGAVRGNSEGGASEREQVRKWVTVRGGRVAGPRNVGRTCSVVRLAKTGSGDAGGRGTRL